MAERDENGRFLPGYKGGPGRPPKGEALTDILRAKLDKHAIAEKLIALAMEKEDLSALKYIYDRIDGRPVETVNQTIREIPDFVGFAIPDDATDEEADQ